MNQRLAIRIVLAAVVAALSIGALAVPAQAASSLSYCFQYSNGHAYGGEPVTLRAWQSSTGTWVTVNSNTTALNGCGAFNMSGGYQYLYMTVWAQKNVISNGRTLFVWSGKAPYYAGVGAGNYNIGTGVVSCTPVATVRC